MNDDIKFKGAIILLLVIIGLAVGAVSVVGFAGKGFDTRLVLDQFSLYGVIALAATFILAASFFIIIKKTNVEYFETIYFSSHDKSILPFFRKWSGLKLFMFFLIIFSIFGIFITIQQIQFTGLSAPDLSSESAVSSGLVEQQFTRGGALLYNLFLIPASENLMVHALTGLILLFFLLPLAFRFKWSKPNYLIFSILLFMVLFGILGVANHLLRYGSEEGSLLVVAMFWAFGGLITAITGSFIPFWVMHIVNNFFLEINRWFSNDIIIAGIIVGEIILITLFFYLFVGKNKGQSENAGEIKQT